MANREHITLLKSSIERWNIWRESYPKIEPEFDRVDFNGLNLKNANLRRANFDMALLNSTNFEGADLTKALFSGSDLRGANLNETDCSAAKFHGADLYGCSFKMFQHKKHLLPWCMV